MEFLNKSNEIRQWWRAHLNALGYRGVISIFWAQNLTTYLFLKDILAAFLSSMISCLAIQKQKPTNDDETDTLNLCGLYDVPILAIRPVAKPY